VFGLARRPDAIASARDRHPRIHWLLADVTQSSQLDGAFARVLEEAGRIDVLVNNAGIFAIAPLEHTTDELIRGHFEINVFGAIAAARAALPALKASRGTIINISSAAGHKAVPNGSVYGATKAALESLTRSWALELAPAGVRVNAIAPGPTETPVFGKLGFGEGTQGVKDAFVAQTPLGRIATSEEIARWILALGEPAASFVTGQIWSVDGGMSLK
jgi:NAD(P)-dependent dehydrogenase (short-subunit alcohol dehydrogenase family)